MKKKEQRGILGDVFTRLTSLSDAAPFLADMNPLCLRPRIPTLTHQS